MVTIARRAPALTRCPAPGQTPRRCSGCGRTESAELRQLDRRRPNLPQGQRWLTAGDLDVAWLIPSGCSFIEVRFCRACAPAGSMIDIECAACGDGPLVLLGETLPGMPVDERAKERGIAFLRAAGWRSDEGDQLCCPACGPR